MSSFVLSITRVGLFDAIEDRRRFEAVALRAVGSEPLKVWILTIMASRAVENFAGGAFFELIGALNAEPGLLGTLASRRCRHPYAMPARECWRRHERDILRGRRPIC